MSGEINKLTGRDLIFQTVSPKDSSEDKKEEVNSIMDSLQDENGSINSQELLDALKEKYNFEDPDSLEETVNALASYDDDLSSLSVDELDSEYLVETMDEAALVSTSASTASSALEDIEVIVDEIQPAAEVQETENTQNTQNTQVQQQTQQQEKTVNIGSQKVSEQTYADIKAQIANEIEQKRQELSDTKKDRGWLTSAGNAIASFFGGGDKKTESEIEKLEKAYAQLETNPAKMESVYKTVMGKKLDAQEIAKTEDVNQVMNSLTSDAKVAIANVLLEQMGAVQEGLNEVKGSNGWLSGAWDGIKNWTGIGASSNKTQTSINNAIQQLQNVKNDPDSLAIAYKNITGKDLTSEEYQKLYDGETSLMNSSKAADKVAKYADGQQMVTDVVADVVVGITAAAAAVAAPFTGGASLIVFAGVGAATGAIVKPAIKASDALTGGREYTLKDLGYDAVTGGVGGAVSGATAGFGSVAKSGVGIAGKLYNVAGTTASKAAGLPFLGKVVGAGSRIASTKVGSIAANAIKVGAKRYVTGFAAGSTDAMARAALEGRTDEMFSDAIKYGNAAGIGSVAIGATFDIVGSGASKISSKLSKAEASLGDDLSKGLSSNADDISKAAASNADDISKAAASNVDDLSKASAYSADDLANAQSKVDEAWNEAMKYAGEEVPESIQKQLSDATDELNKIKNSMKPSYTPDDLANAQSKVDEAWNEAMKYAGEEVPESVQKQLSDATDEFNKIKGSLDSASKVTQEASEAGAKTAGEIIDDVTKGFSPEEFDRFDALLGEANESDLKKLLTGISKNENGEYIWTDLNTKVGASDNVIEAAQKYAQEMLGDTAYVTNRAAGEIIDDVTKGFTSEEFSRFDDLLAGGTDDELEKLLTGISKNESGEYIWTDLNSKVSASDNVIEAAQKYASEKLGKPMPVYASVVDETVESAAKTSRFGKVIDKAKSSKVLKVAGRIADTPVKTVKKLGGGVVKITKAAGEGTVKALNSEAGRRSISKEIPRAFLDESEI